MVGELRSHKPRNLAENKKREENPTTSFKEIFRFGIANKGLWIYIYVFLQTIQESVYIFNSY